MEKARRPAPSHLLLPPETILEYVECFRRRRAHLVAVVAERQRQGQPVTLSRTEMGAIDFAIALIERERLAQLAVTVLEDRVGVDE